MPHGQSSDRCATHPAAHSVIGMTTTHANTTVRPRLAIIVGSVRTDRFGPVPSAWFADKAREHGAMDVEVLDIADYDLPTSLDSNDDVVALGEKLAAADAFVVVTPEYNHSFPAGLKTAIDHYKPEWAAKPVAFVSYGGMAGGLRAVEQLRQVFAELHAVTIRNSISFHNFWDTFGDDGQPSDAASASSAAKQLLDQLMWWTVALKTAREQHPYTS
ncbi:putative flavoprotein [Saccharomonospora xinjiangensis XJ-54]|uniref:Putative flavoprotein n=2 Tax=Saccharomonospora TaxID=1851 RepID=I0V337_9PSEU|nr:putative flavoprotein [Saccharomonospora xinjiangensis XJ-54]